MTKGTYQREIIALSALDWVAGAEYEVTAVASNIIASTAQKDELYSWVRGTLFVYDVTSGITYEWMLIKSVSSDATQDLNDSDVVEKLHKERRIFARGLVLVPDPDAGGPVKPISFQVYNVALPYGEELRLLLRPIRASGTANGRIDGLIEWRQVGS